MLRPRIIPCLLLSDGGLVKTVRFSDPKYVGDPLNAVRIFNEKEVDELIVIDIEATQKKREPDYELIAQLASECRMPLCYGGGVNRLDQFQRIIELGVEKVAIGAAALTTPDLITEVAAKIGSQSVVAVLDVLKGERQFELRANRGVEKTGLEAISYAAKLESLGVGEVVINNIDRDGTMIGYDLELIRSIRERVSVPLTALGGAASLEDIKNLVSSFGSIGAAAGSLFVFKGQYRAVLINYPRRPEVAQICAASRSATVAPKC